MIDTSDESIVERTRVRWRYVEPDQSDSDLGALACRAVVKDAGLEMSQIDLLITNTITRIPGAPFPAGKTRVGRLFLSRHPPTVRRVNLRFGDC